MTIREALNTASKFLLLAEVDTPFLDASLLLGQVLKLPREKLFAHLNENLTKTHYQVFQELLIKRASGQPVSYLRNCKEFYSFEFYVDERVLVPRPETETLVDLSLDLIKREKIKKVLDLCCGCGCLAITLKALQPKLEIYGSDISAEAGEVFKLNSQKILKTDLPFIQSDLFVNIKTSFDLIVSNPPYLKKELVAKLKETGWPEPALALDGGEQGTELLLKIIEQAFFKLNVNGYLLLEASFEQMKRLAWQFESCGYKMINIVKDLSGKERVIYGQKGN